MTDDEGSPQLVETATTEFLRFAFSKVCHSERSEESAVVCIGPELPILRFAQEDSLRAFFTGLDD